MSASRLNLPAGQRHSLWTAAAAAILAFAFVLRVFIAFPVHKYQADADGIVPGLCALTVMHGSHPIFFPGGYRLGAQSCYVTAEAFSLFGVSRSSLMLTGLLFTSLFVVFMYLYLRESFGPKFGLMGLLLVAAPPQQLVINTYVPWAYGEILMYCASTLWLAVVVNRLKNARLFWFFALGMSAGLALWCSAQSLMITLPIMFWLLWNRALHSFSGIGLAAVGMFTGSLPIWIFLAGGGATKMMGEGLTHTANSSGQILSNASYLFSTEIPWLLVDKVSSTLTPISADGAAILIYALAVLVLVALALWPKSAIRKQPVLRAQTALLGLIALFCAVIYVFSAAGSVRGWTVRYMLPLYLIVPGVASILCAVIKRSLLVIPALAVAFLMMLNARMYPSTISPLGKSLRIELVADQMFLKQLRQSGIQAVLGDYWDVYELNFDSGGTIAGIPIDPRDDYFKFADDIGQKKLHWAILDKTPRLLTEWQRRMNSTGEISSTATGRFLSVPKANSPNGDAAAFLSLARQTHPTEGYFPSGGTESKSSAGLWIKNQFKTLLLRDPTTQETSKWTEALDRGTRSQADLVEDLLTSSEFEQLCLPQFWAYLHQHGRPPSRAEWLKQPQPATGSRTNLATPHSSKDRNQAIVQLLYFSLLERDSDPAGMAFWSATLDRSPLRSLITGFLQSPENDKRGYVQYK